jgi:hypothetical protein
MKVKTVIARSMTAKTQPQTYSDVAISLLYLGYCYQEIASSLLILTMNSTS